MIASVSSEAERELIAARAPGFAIVVHTGRKSGATYETPINAFRTANGPASR